MTKLARLGCFVTILIFSAACSRQSEARKGKETQKDEPATTASVPAGSSSPATPAPPQENPPTSLESLREAAESGDAMAQRNLAIRFLMGQGVPADQQEAVRWVKKSAYNGDPTAMLWAGRACLNEADGRIDAAAWFLAAGKSNNAAIRQDASGELEALELTPAEHTQAVSRATELEKTISRNPQ
jgi:TPR repeat protein